MKPEVETLRAWLGLLHTPGIGPATFFDLLESSNGDPVGLFHPETQRVLPADLRARLGRLDWSRVDADLKWAEAADNHIVCWSDAGYPQLLRQIPDPPPVLFVHGDPDCVNTAQIAIIGSRNPTAGGAENAQAFASHLARLGLTITSGLALGIDAASHRGALAANGITLAVTGTGLDRIYPAAHRELAHTIIDQGGALVSEFPVGTPPKAENFPRRNRIISGLSLGTLVVEAALRSGSLITARHALEQGREVFAIPGSIHNPLAKGCHALIRQGAKLVESGADILEELGPLFSSTLPLNDGSVADAGCARVTPAPSELSEEQIQLLDLMSYETVSVDQLVARSGLTAAAVSSMLLILELDGRVISRAGGRYVRSDKRG